MTRELLSIALGIVLGVLYGGGVVGALAVLAYVVIVLVLV